MRLTKKTLLLFFIIFQPIFASAEQITIPIVSYFWNTPVIKINIQNQKIPVQFDLGNTSSMLDLFQPLSGRIKTTPSKKQDCSSDINGKITCQKHYIIRQVKIAGITFSNVDTRFISKINGNMGGENPPIRKIHQIQGVAGLNLIVNNGFGILIDYPKNKIILTDDSKPPRNIKLTNWFKIPFDFNSDGIFSSVLVNGRPIKLIWDTGGGHSIFLLNKRTQGLKTKLCKIKKCNKLAIQLGKADNRKLITSFEIYKADIPFFDGLIGYDFFKAHEVFIDFKNRVIFVK